MSASSIGVSESTSIVSAAPSIMLRSNGTAIACCLLEFPPRHRLVDDHSQCGVVLSRALSEPTDGDRIVVRFTDQSGDRGA